MEHKRGKFTIGCDVIQADKLSEKLAALLPLSPSDRTAATLRLGLREMLINAIEHGSLEIGFDQKSEAAAKIDYLEFVLDRQKSPEYSGRKVDVEYHITGKSAVFRISDQGHGFDHKRMRENALKGENEFDLAHGRGIRMTLRIFDKVRYNTIGNRVTLLKKIAMPVSAVRAG